MRFLHIYLVTALVLPASGQSLDSLVSEALEKNPEILAAQKRYEAARQRPSRESSLPDPTLSLGYASNGNPLPGAGLGTNPTSNIGLMVSQEMPFPGKRKLRGEIAEREADAELEQYLAVRLNVISRLKQAYHQLHHDVAAVEIMRRNQILLRNFIRITESRYSVGRAAQQDVFRAQTQYSILETQVLRMQQDQVSRTAEINSLLNRSPGGALTVPMEMAAGELAVTLDDLLAHARAESPTLARNEKMIQRNELATNLARKDFYPDYLVSGGYFNQGGMPPMYQFRVDLKIPLYFWRKQRAAVNEQVSALEESRRAYEAAGQSLAFRIRDEYANAQTARRLMDLYSKSVIPQAKLALESSTASYETGALDFLPLLMNFMTVVDYELNYHEEMLRFHLALARLEELTGLRLDR